MASSSKGVVLLSGGIDSATTMALAAKQGFSVYALSFDYGQRHRQELDSARRIVAFLGAAGHVVAKIDLRAFGGSALTAEIDVPKARDFQATAAEIPITYVPARNTIFLSFALGWCEVLGAQDIFIGANAIDYSGYPDCRPQFLEAFESLAALATKAGVEGTAKYRIHAPLLRMTKAEIIRTGIKAGVDFSLTHSCYDPSPAGLSCGACDSCILRRRGFAEAGVADPTRYIRGTGHSTPEFVDPIRRKGT
ncbi:MAG TPA: 7-cyano-7-deazaguanine synthase QueC [Acidobacteriota bacterium]|nr:7-cyano-7-deazaguanine synthase QueC [Acidobacteriota bacterium]